MLLPGRGVQPLLLQTVVFLAGHSQVGAVRFISDFDGYRAFVHEPGSLNGPPHTSEQQKFLFSEQLCLSRQCLTPFSPSGIFQKTLLIFFRGLLSG